MASSSDRTGLAFRQGWRRVLGAPALVAGVWLVMLIGALPAAWAVNTAIAHHVGPSLGPSALPRPRTRAGGVSSLPTPEAWPYAVSPR